MTACFSKLRYYDSIKLKACTDPRTHRSSLVDHLATRDGLEIFITELIRKLQGFFYFDYCYSQHSYNKEAVITQVKRWSTVAPRPRTGSDRVDYIATNNSALVGYYSPRKLAMEKNCAVGYFQEHRCILY